MDISSMLEVEVKEVKEAESKENVTPQLPRLIYIPSSVTQEESDFYRVMFGTDIASVRFRRLHCTACDVHIGSAPSQAHNMFEHPILRTLLCAQCRDFYGDGTFEQGDDATDMFCRWCANGGNLYCCSFCSNTFCYKCIRRNFDSIVRKRIAAVEKWKCFVCDPRDLYSARAICWALLQHVQTVTRILQNDRKMTADEIEQKMNLDESQCCPRKRKRKRRRTGSNSEEDDKTYVPGLEDGPLKRKYRRKNTTTNGAVNHTRPQSALSVRSSNSLWSSDSFRSTDSFRSPNASTERRVPEEDYNLPLLSAIPCEQTMIEGESEDLTTDTPATMPHSISEVEKTPPAKLDKLPTISAVPTVNLLQTPYRAQLSQARRIKTILPTSPAGASMVSRPVTSDLSSDFSPIPVTRQQACRNSLISPARNTTQKRARVLLPKSKNTSSSTPNASSVIEIEIASDSDEDVSMVPEITSKEPVQAAQTAQSSTTADTSKNISNDATNSVSSPANNAANNVPNNVVSDTANSTANTNAKNKRTPSDSGIVWDIVKQSLIKIPTESSEKAFNQSLFKQNREIDLIIVELKNKLNKILTTKRGEVDESTLSTGRAKTRCIHRAINRAISRLAYVNNEMIKKYDDLKRSETNQKLKNAKQSDSNVTEKTNKNDDEVQLTLDMTCVRDSDTEGQCEESDEETDMTINDFEEIIRPFAEKDTIERSVNTEPAKVMDKSTQAFDVILRDYEKCIGYALLMKADYDPKRKVQRMKPVQVPNEHAGKYEEQFIFYLQHIEDNGIETEDCKGLPDPNETPLKDLIEANSPFISEMLQSIGASSPVTNTAIVLGSSDEGNGAKGDNTLECISLENMDAETVEESIEVIEVSEIQEESATSNDSDAMAVTESEDKSEKSPSDDIQVLESETAKVADVSSENIDKTKDEETILAVRTLIDSANGDKQVEQKDNVCTEEDYSEND
ncbi:uncharacterized protein LOC105701641 [Orussus abietinus]|uniref:uncharacterized protein LOC105701641 n=1 Tax=Orussus abietinus TaxID=222816 RepID=UPI00062556A8|nr:uncharacterized protein LOC105701641 [Orussus abietinus]XP_012283981.1 uncharacterized protein LOC105701641 [Orussus abietinus]